MKLLTVKATVGCNVSQLCNIDPLVVSFPLVRITGQQWQEYRAAVRLLKMS